MPFVKRSETGQIIELHLAPSESCTEELPLTHPDIAAFMGTQDGSLQTLMDLSKTDMEMARVLEDLIILLILKGVIRREELPMAAQEKLEQREVWRDSLADAEELFGGEKLI